MRLAPAPASGWDTRIASPILSEGFALASRGMGYEPLFAEDERDRALILVRSVPLPILRAFTLRAKVYVDRGHGGFVGDLLDDLRARGVAHVKLNDERHGLGAGLPRGMTPTPRRVLFIEPAGKSDGALRDAMHDPVPRNIRKAERAGVGVEAIRSEDELRAFCALMAETRERMRSRHIAAVYPDAFFRGVYQHMVPRGQALLLLACADGVPLAGQMYLVGPDRLTYYHGASTRARALTPKHGPTATFWHALRLARDRGIGIFDLGAVTPTADATDIHFSVTDFKRRWGGRATTVAGAEVVLSPAKVAFQDRLLKPFWDRAHPLYLRVFGWAA